MIGGDPDELRSYASPACFLHELGPDYFAPSDCGPAPTGSQPGESTDPQPTTLRLVPGRPFPPYAYLPGHFPHPIRDPRGHSFADGSSPAADDNDKDAFLWGADLFNHGFYWEAHEAWESIWRRSPPGDPCRDLVHGLILLAAAGVKRREHKWAAARRHAARAASYLGRIDETRLGDLRPLLGGMPSRLVALAAQVARDPICYAEGQVAFDFTVGRLSGHAPGDGGHPLSGKSGREE